MNEITVNSSYRNLYIFEDDTSILKGYNTLFQQTLLIFFTQEIRVQFVGIL